jgi:hypothetical protein
MNCGEGHAVEVGNGEEPVVTHARASFDRMRDPNLARALVQRGKEG